MTNAGGSLFSHIVYLFNIFVVFCHFVFYNLICSKKVLASIGSVRKGKIMAKYYVNTNPQNNGDHEVHQEGCSWMPDERVFLGDYASCDAAVEAAKKYYPKSNGCYYCSRECHTG